MDPGGGLSRVQDFLLSSLRPSTLVKYTEALSHLSNDLREQGCNWQQMTDEERDMFLAEWVLDGFEGGESRNAYGWALSAVQKVCPRLRLKTSWKVYDVWGSKQPIRQALAAPPEFLHGMIAIAMLVNRAELGLLMVLCYAGLLRVREALGLRRSDLVLGASEIIVCLGLTKRGTEQKVVLRNMSVILFVQQFLQSYPRHSDELLFTISYGSALRWVKRISFFLGGEQMVVTTHTFRRSGASELARQGTPLPDILLFGRWQSERSARDYIRQGEVGIHRARVRMDAALQRRVLSWASLLPNVWVCHLKLFAHKTVAIKVDRLTVSAFQQFEKAVFSSFALTSELDGREAISALQ